MSADLIAALEIGTSQARIALAEIPEPGLLAVRSVQTVRSSGLRKSQVVDVASATRVVQLALDKIEETMDCAVEEVSLAVSGSDTQASPAKGTVPASGEDRSVTREDVDRALELARDVQLPADRERLHTVPQRFLLNETHPVDDPAGMEAASVTAQVLLVHAGQTPLRNLVRAVRGAEVEVGLQAFSGICAGLAVLPPEDKGQGVAVIDLGGGSTNYLVYARGHIAAAGSLPVGGDHVTNDLVQGLGLSSLRAERLKADHGGALVREQDRFRKAKAPAVSASEPEREFSLYDVRAIMNARMDELFQMLAERFQREELLESLHAGVVLTGGGAYMREVAELAERALGRTCRVGLPVGFAALPSEWCVPEHATVLGLLRYTALNGATHPGRSGIGRLFRRLLPRRTRDEELAEEEA